jgi:hypothetical protein
MSHADLATLIAYWFGELDEACEAALEEHYLGCGECSARLAEVEALASGVRRAFSNGLVRGVVTPAFVEKVRASGVRVREYRVPWNGSVNCTVAPEDEMLFSRLQAPLEGVGRVDVILGSSHGAQGDLRLEDVPFDAATGEVVMSPSIVHIKTMPAYRQVMRLVAVEAGKERLLGEYTFNHTPHG